MTGSVGSVVGEFDVIIVGFGGAGAAAAIEAADRGARVLVLDRAHGGGATALSGGVVYAGGGTSYQRQEGYEDTPENMFGYLRAEVGDAVSEATLRRFCEESPAMITWLEQLGVPFAGGVPPYKTSYPIDGYYLYYSGNEKAYPYAEHATPAPRGHRTVATGLGSGAKLYDQLKNAALARGVEFIPLSRVHELIIEDGRIRGVRYRVLRDRAAGTRHDAAMARRARVTRRGSKIGNWFPQIVPFLTRRAERVWQAGAIAEEARADSVILAAGGFVFNREWMARWAGPYIDANPLGTVGDDGSGIALGLSAGGQTDYMDHMTGWRFLSPPSTFIEGVSVGLNGRRIANEDLYGATFTGILAHEFQGNGRVVFDSLQWNRARAQIGEQSNLFQGFQARYQFRLGRKRARTLPRLAERLGVDPDALVATVDAYNDGIASGAGDPAHKAADVSTPVLRPPFYGIDISIKNVPAYPATTLTLGGLRVDELSGEVLDASGNGIQGLYAAGRTAVGLCSNGYLSGLSVADCVFSGRRAGAHAAQRRVEQASRGSA